MCIFWPFIKHALDTLVKILLRQHDLFERKLQGPIAMATGTNEIDRRKGIIEPQDYGTNKVVKSSCFAYNAPIPIVY